MAAGVDNLLKIDEQIRKHDTNVQRTFTSNISKMQWKAGELQFEAYMRMLDSRVSMVYQLLCRGRIQGEGCGGCKHPYPTPNESKRFEIASSGIAWYCPEAMLQPHLC